MVKLARAIRSTQAAIAIVLGVLTLIFEWWQWLWAWPLLLAATHFAANFAFILHRHSLEKRTENLSEYARHQDLPASAFDEVLDFAGRHERFMARLSGVAVSGKGLVAPLTGRSCVAWNLEVDLFRLGAWAGESSYEPLFERSCADGMRIVLDGGRVEIDSPCVVDAGNVVEELLGFKRLDERRELSSLVADAMELSGRNRGKYRGVRVRESLVEREEPVNAWGALSKEKDGFVLRGVSEPERPDTLLVRSERRKDKRAWRARRKASMGLQAALATVLVAGAWLVSPLGPWSIDDRWGTVYFDPGKNEYLFTAVDYDEGEDGRWMFLREEELSNVRLTYDGTTLQLGGEDAIIVESLAPIRYLLDFWSSAWPKDAGDAWLLTLPESAPSGAAGTKKGIIRVKNSSGRDFYIEVITRDKAARFDSGWSFARGEGMDSANGLALSEDGTRITVSEGDLVALMPKEDDVPSLWVPGADGKIEWRDGGNGEGFWFLNVEKGMIEPRVKPLRAINPLPHWVQITVYNGYGDVIAETDLPPGFGVGTEGGKQVNHDGKRVSIQPGNRIAIVVEVATTIYSGPLGKYPGAIWRDGDWHLKP